MVLVFLLGKQELQLQSQRPFGTEGRFFRIVEALYLGVHRLAADAEDLAHATAQGNRPGIVAVGFPVCRDNGRRHQIPSVGKVVVDKRLNQRGVDIIAVVITGKRPEVARQSPKKPWPANGQGNG